MVGLSSWIGSRIGSGVRDGSEVRDGEVSATARFETLGLAARFFVVVIVSLRD